MTHNFTFKAYALNTHRECVITVTIADDGRPFVDLADDAEERAYTLAAKKLRCGLDELEVIEE